MNDKTFVNIENPNEHIAMDHSTNFQSIWKNPDYGSKFAQKNISDKDFGEVNIKVVINIQQCTPVPNSI